ncbi:PTH2-domain-containing protein [Daldinia loculata]|uniref:PTH2-domain-containing protein n=1 Tax=Daldinia loculata TaxID=103429 RepID=UPI0020C40F32|nr:PTH2-domain-containing protein [Daldinia loculata]KAI1649572.1 PTH2-domain-containing protein [Daldinia loculata]KAI2783046.1 PTH2-domain-containing protein [Daldinia loculata]
MADKSNTTILISTSIVVFLSGFLLGMYSVRGYLFISPSLASQRLSNFNDPLESEESDIDEDDTILDHAPNWANGEDADRRDGLKASNSKKAKKTSKDKAEDKADSAQPQQTVAEGSANEECKLVLVVRTDLGMTKGKIAAQCSHATLACYKTLTRAAQRNPSSAEARLLQRWERRGQAKIAVQVKSEAELLDLMGKARSLGITAEVIQDAGRTQIDPGSLTVLGVGPAPKSLVDKVTGGLKLL